MLGRHERPLEQLGGVDVRGAALGQLPDRAGVAPGPLVVLRMQEVEREQRRELDAALPGALLEHGADASVDLAPAAEGEALVGDRPEEIVPEPQLVRPFPGHELTESSPAVEVADIRELVGEDIGQEVELEVGPEDRGVSKEEAIARLERVDPGGDQRLDRLRKHRSSAVGAGGVDELAHEERIAARALRDHGEQLLGERGLACRCQRELRSRLAGERRQLEQPVTVPRLVEERRALGPARDRQEPGPGRAAAHEVEEEAVRGVVDPMRVLEDDERRHHEHAEQELLDGPEDALAPEGRLDVLGLRCHRHFRVEGNRE